jgi:peroxiredoxin
MGLLVLGGIAFIGYFLWSRQNSTSTQQAAQQTQAMAQALTGLPVSTQLPTWTWTPSPSPSATPTPSGTATITLTPEDTPTETPIPASQIGPEVRLFAPDFTLTDSVSGQDVSLSQFRGQPILLYFWNTNCLDCLVEISDLNDVYAQYERRGLVLLAIASGDSLTEVNQYRISRGITFPTLLDPNRTITSLYEAFSMPVHFFIGPNGRIATIAKGRIDKIELQRQVSLIVLALPTATPTP